MVFEGLEGSAAHTPATEGALHLISGSYKEELLDIFKMDLIDWFGGKARQVYLYSTFHTQW